MGLLQKIALGGGCHWCTEAVFESLIGVEKVEQGFIASTCNDNLFSEGVVVHYNPENISLKTLIKIHLHTHKSTSNHSMRKKYRSAVYPFSKTQMRESEQVIETLQKDFNHKLITEVLPYKTFKSSRDEITNYYYKNPEKPFCKTYINPKIKIVLEQFASYANRKAQN
jgi:peptide-methionine (S)-S-oxide reductase